MCLCVCVFVHACVRVCVVSTNIRTFNGKYLLDAVSLKTNLSPHIRIKQDQQSNSAVGKRALSLLVIICI